MIMVKTTLKSLAWATHELNSSTVDQDINIGSYSFLFLIQLSYYVSLAVAGMFIPKAHDGNFMFQIHFRGMV